jgi:dihydropteroate synthase
VDFAVLQEFSNYLKTLNFYGKTPAFLSDVAFVVIPDLDTINDAEKALLSLEKNMVFAQKLGFEKLIADPILSPPGTSLFPSLSNYFAWHQKYPNTPLLFGIGNVTELFDADSVGINALLSSFAHECGASVLFTPDASDKCKGAVRELKRASEMMILSGIRHSSLKDLGIDLLILKEKRKKSELNLSLVLNQIENHGTPNGFPKKPKSKSSKFESSESESSKFESSKSESSKFESSESESFNSESSKSESSNSESSNSKSLNSESSKSESDVLLLSGSLNPAFIPGTKWSWKPDAAGNFIIGVTSASEIAAYLRTVCHLKEERLEKLKNVKTPGQRVIVAVHPQKIIIGTDSAFMMEAIINENLITELSHAGYLGRELQKAEIAVLLGRSYSQDDVF